MSKKVIVLIEKFISGVKERYPRLIIGYDYCSETEEYNIWHIDSKLQFEDEDFIKFVGRLMKEILLDNNVFDFKLVFVVEYGEGIIFNLQRKTVNLPGLKK
ncbi:MAG: hypothetical protein PHX01_07365 [Clostridia bacterium]|nr:hypothetical protein [Clostridia bacterium]